MTPILSMSNTYSLTNNLVILVAHFADARLTCFQVYSSSSQNNYIFFKVLCPPHFSYPSIHDNWNGNLQIS